MTRANSVRGEAKLTVGCHQLVVAIEFARLAAFSAASGLHDIGQCFNALIALSPAHAEAALEAFVSEVAQLLARGRFLPSAGAHCLDWSMKYGVRWLNSNSFGKKTACQTII